MNNPGLGSKTTGRAVIIMIFCLFLLSIQYSIKAAAFSHTSQQNPLHITFLNGACHISGPIVFDSTDGPWYPGYSQSKSFYIKNESRLDCNLGSIKFEMESLNKLNDGSSVDPYTLDRFKEHMGVKLQMEGNSIFDDNLEVLENTGELLRKKTKIAYGQDKEFDLTIYMDVEADNSLQNLISEFNIIIECSASDDSPIKPPIYTPPPAPTPTPTPTPVPPEPTPAPTPMPDVLPIESILPSTGSFVDMNMLIVTGLLLSGIGSILLIKRKK